MKTVLVIEDEQIVQEAIQDWLEAEGFQTLGALGGAAGIELAQTCLPDLILCDILMPDVDGYEVLTNLRQNLATATIPFIFLTVKGSKAEMRYGMELGADDYLAKPCTARELINAVTSRLRKQSRIQTRTQQQLETLRNSIAFSLPHEFRTPITGILTGVELLRVIADNPHEVLEVANSLEECTERLYGLVKKFLCYAEIEILVRDSERLKTLKLMAFCNPVEMLQVSAEQIACKYQRESDLLLSLQEANVAFLEEHLKKMTEELIDNAFKFSEAGTTVQIIGRLDQAAEQTIEKTTEKTTHQINLGTNQYILSIINQGSGLTPEQITAIGAYIQFDRPHYEQQGVGLGLSIARRIAELYGGRLTISSTPNVETIVQVILPATEWREE